MRMIYHRGNAVRGIKMKKTKFYVGVFGFLIVANIVMTIVFTHNIIISLEKSIPLGYAFNALMLSWTLWNLFGSCKQFGQAVILLKEELAKNGSK